MTTRTERDLAAAEQIALAVLALRPNDEMMRRATARLMEAQDRGDEALPLWRGLLDAGRGDFEAAFHVARALMADGASASDAAAKVAPDGTGALAENLVSVLDHPVRPIAGALNHVAICGVSYCGSTLLDRVLGGLPDVRSIGESHWLVKERTDTGYEDIDFQHPRDQWKMVPCTVCGKSCQTLTHDFRAGLAADHRDWYAKIAAQLGTRNLISADKNAPKLVDNDPFLNLSALVVFKSPEQAWWSHRTKLPADRDAEYYETQCRTYTAVWVKSYRVFLDTFKPAGTVAYLNFDAFAAAPEQLLRAICLTFHLPFDAGVLERTEPGHAIGGNKGSMARLRSNDYAVKIEALPPLTLSDAEAAIIAGDEDVQRTWDDLMKQHGVLAGHVAAREAADDRTEPGSRSE